MPCSDCAVVHEVNVGLQLGGRTYLGIAAETPRERERDLAEGVGFLKCGWRTLGCFLERVIPSSLIVAGWRTSPHSRWSWRWDF